MDQAPEPLVHAEVDLRGLEYMPFFGHHLLGSEFHARCTDAEWRAGVTLWWASWNQVPAASLPDDDIALCRLADLGRDVKGWKKLRENALHGFVLCSDGRLYHRFLAAQALVAWDKRVKEREKKRKWREGRNGPGDRDNPGQSTGTEQGTEPGRNGSGTADVTGSDVTGREVKTNPQSALSQEARSGPPGTPLRALPAFQDPSPNPENRSAEKPPPDPTRAGLLSKLLREQGVLVTPSNPFLLGWVESEVTDREALDAVETARFRKPKPEQIHAAYLDPIVRDMRTKPRVNGSHGPIDWRKVWPDMTDAEFAEFEREKAEKEASDRAQA